MKITVRLITLLLLPLTLSTQAYAIETCDRYTDVKKAACLQMRSKIVDNGKSMSAAALLGFIEFENEFEQGGFHLYRRGLIEGVQASNAALKYHNKAPLYCVPDEFKLGLQANKIVENAIAMDAELGSEPYQFVLLMELIRIYECK